MAKVSLLTIVNLDNPTTAVSQLNTNFTRLAEQIDLLLSRDGEAPNTLLASIDMNGFRILNLPEPTSPTEPARHGDIQQYVDEAEAARDAAQLAQVAAETAEVNAELAETNAEQHLDDFYTQYGGAQASDPTVDPSGDPVQPGFLYFNTTLDTFRYWYEDIVKAGTDSVVVGTDIAIVGEYYSIPAPTLSSLADVDGINVTNLDILQWNEGQSEWLPIALSAANVTFDDTSTDLNASTVQGALEDLVDRTSLGRYDLSFWAGSRMENDELLFRLVSSRTFWIPAGATNSVADAGTAANAETVLLLKKNNVQFGTITYAASGTTGTFSVAAETVFNTGDVFSVHGPATADTSLADVSFTIAARR